MADQNTTPAPTGEGLDAYDAGLLSDYGGGMVGWWQDYLRAELARAHDHYVGQHAALITAQAAEIERLRGWLAEAQKIIHGMGERLTKTTHYLTTGRMMVEFAADMKAALSPAPKEPEHG